MSSERWPRVEELFHQAAGLAPAQRAAFLENTCAGDGDLRRDVESLLAHDASNEDVLGAAVGRAVERLPGDSGVSADLVGKRLGPYVIEGLIGKGGMGHVFKARDTRLDRTVAIKILPQHLSTSALRVRFEREGRAVARLNHPHICTLYDIGHQDGIDYLVMECLEGETLAQRLKKGPLPLDQALLYAIEVADALDWAHSQGVVHRDLKPANIMLTKDGSKVLDFGLAKVGARQPSPQDATQTLALTREGTILGTFQYMAPEQLEGKEADARTDIFAFGAVLYEMATGRRAFEGNNQASLIAAIMSSDPAPISALEPLSPPALDHVVSTCLAKEPDQRWQSDRDLLLELKWTMEAARRQVLPNSATETAMRFPWRWIAAAATLLSVLSIVIAWLYVRGIPQEAREIQLFVSPPENGVLGESLSLSPDGSYLVFPVTVEGKTQLWLRPLNSLIGHSIPGTEGASYPFWSAGGQFIAFFSEGKLKKIDFSGGQAQTLCRTGSGAGGTWNQSGVIVFSGGNRDVIYRVPERGGEPVALTKLDPARQEFFHGHPHFLPDGRHFVYLARGTLSQNNAIYIGSIEASAESQNRKPLLGADSMIEYAPPHGRVSGHLLFLQDSTLMAQPFDERRLAIRGERFPIAEQVEYFSRTGMSPFSVSSNGLLAYRGGSVTYTQPIWFDRQGNQLRSLGLPAEYRHPWMAPDEKHLTVDRLDFGTGNRNVWLFDLSSGAGAQLTFDHGVNRRAIWSPDGSRIVFNSDREDHQNLYKISSAGGATEESFLETADEKYPTDWSSDGRFILLDAYSPQSKLDIWVLSIDPGRAVASENPTPFLQTPSVETQGRFSPDGKWVAFTSDQTGKPEVFLASFPRPDQRWQISNGGGGDPRWRADGKELVFIGADRTLMSVDTSAKSSFEGISPKRLFKVRVTGLSDTRTHYAISRDGQRFLVNTLVQTAVSSPITVVVNWTAGLKR